MSRAALVLVLTAAVAGCKADTDDSLPVPAAAGSGSGSAKHNFGAELNEDLAGSAKLPAGSAKLPAGSASAPVIAGSGSGASPSLAVVASGSGRGTPSPVATTGTGTPPAVAAGNPLPVLPTGPATGSGSAAVALAPPQSSSPRVPAKVSPELAAIKLSLQPNWDRDIGDPATISLVVKRPSGDPVVFSFTYGYDDPRAPADRDAYIQFLGEQKLLTVKVNRQRGSAWYLEGTDAQGPAFRYLVNYGGKHLVCYGSLYKDPASAGMGDIRDEVINQAKKICETLAL